MKYLKITASILSIAFIYLFYLYIPNRIVFAGTDYLPKSKDSTKRGILEIQYWDKWMPYKKVDGHSFIFEEGKMEVGDAFLSSAKCKYSIDDVYVPVIFTAVDAGSDSILFTYECNMYNRFFSPIKRMQNYLIAKKIEHQLIPIMAAAKKYYSEPALKDTVPKK
jgi:hypothetical protein